MYEEVFNEYYDTAGNYHWTGTLSGEHFVPLDGAIHIQPMISNMSIDMYSIAEDSHGIPQY